VSGLYLYAVNPDGTIKWKSVANGITAPVIGKNGTIYVADGWKNIRAINPDGTLKWTYPVGELVWGTPVLSKREIIYFGTNDSVFYALKPNGKLKWKYEASDWYWNAPCQLALDAKGRIYFANHNGTLYVLNPKGKLRWKFEHSANHLMAPPAIGPRGTIYFWAGWQDPDSYCFYALSKRGRELWNFSPNDENNSVAQFSGSPVIGSNNVIYQVGSGCPYDFWAFDSKGNILWKIPDLFGGISEPVIGIDGTIYFGNMDKYLYAFDNSGNFLWKYRLRDWRISAPCLTSDGTLYIFTGTGHLYAFQTDSKGMDNSAWPKFHQNNQNTGRAPSLK
jgi:outer membrane protein assembly factor BamB